MILTLASFTLTCVICYGLYSILKWHVKRRHLHKLAAKFEGPPALPFLGSAHSLAGDSEHVLNKIVEFMESYTSPVRVWLGPLLMFLTNDPEQVKEICLNPKTLGKGELFTDLLGPLLGEGLLTAPVPKWKVHRKLIAPAFNRKILDSFVEIFAVHSTILNEKMEQHLDGLEFEIFNAVISCVLDMVSEATLDFELGTQTDRDSYFVEALQELLAGFAERFFKFWLRPDFIFHRTKLGEEQRKRAKYLHGFTEQIVRMKKKHFLERKSLSSAADDEHYAYDSTPRREGFLDLLMKLTNESGFLTDEELRAEVDTILAAASDTSAITISYVMLMLASLPAVQEKVYQELYEIYGDANARDLPVEHEDLTEMKYLERVIKETMRLFPAVPVIFREVTEDLKIGEHSLPKGTYAVIGIMNLQRSEKYWPDPLEFDPDRFLPEENRKRHPFTFMGFSGGPRNCIGLVSAMMAMKTILATMLRRYRLKKDNILPIKDIRLKYELVLKPVHPITLRIERRIRDED